MEVTCANSNLMVCSCCASAFTNTTTANDDTLPEDQSVSGNKFTSDSTTLSTEPSTTTTTTTQFPGSQQTDETNWSSQHNNAQLKWCSEEDGDNGRSNISATNDNGQNRNNNSTVECTSQNDVQGNSLYSTDFDPEVDKSVRTSPSLGNVPSGGSTSAAESVSETNDKENVCPSSRQMNFPTFSKDRIPEMLALLFEYPYILRKEKTLFTGDNESLVFCPKCEVALSRLYNTFRDFMELLKTEGQVGKILRRVGNEPEPLMPLLVYDTDRQNENDYRKSFGKTRRKLTRGLKQNENNRQDWVYKIKQRMRKPGRQKMRPLPRMTARQKKLSVPAEESDAAEELEEQLASVTDRSEDLSGSDNDNQEIDEDFDPSCADDEYRVDDDSDDPTFSPKKNKGHIERKPELKRRGKKSQWSKQTTSSAEYDGSDVESSAPAPKKKRIRNLKKEFWIEKAKKDPSRTCDICGKAFLYARMMQHHKSTVHEGKKPFECEFCGRGFTQNFILKKHTCDYSLAGGDKEFLRIAREEQLFKWVCDVCGKRFKERSSLTVHQKNHTGETYECDKCGKTFRRPDHLKTHVKIVHSDEKRFVCTTCGQRFKTSSNLRAHERKHANPDQKHLCNICGKSIKTLSQMGRHQKTHEDVLPFECHICGKRFKMKDYLGQHLRKGKSCATKVNRSKPTQSDASASESQDFTSMIAFQPTEPQSSEIHLPVRESVPPLPIEYHHYVMGTTDTGILTNL